MMDVRACGRPDSYGKSFDDKSMICAGYWSGVTDTCVGDSGGPLVCIDEQLQPHVAGIISWGKGCGRAHYPGVYTRVSYYLEWIKSVVRGDVTASVDSTNSINSSNGQKQRKENKKQGKIVIGVIDKPKPAGLAGRSESYQEPQKQPLTFTTLGSLDFSNYDPAKGFSASNAPKTVEQTVIVETTQVMTTVVSQPVVKTTVEVVGERRGVDFDDDFVDVNNETVTDNPGRRDENDSLETNARKYYNPGDKNSRTIGTRTPCGDLFAKYNVNLNVEG